MVKKNGAAKQNIFGMEHDSHTRFSPRFGAFCQRAAAVAGRLSRCQRTRKKKDDHNSRRPNDSA
jgi:hypothetical protein